MPLYERKRRLRQRYNDFDKRPAGARGSGRAAPCDDGDENGERSEKEEG